MSPSPEIATIQHEHAAAASGITIIRDTALVEISTRASPWHMALPQLKRAISEQIIANELVGKKMCNIMELVDSNSSVIEKMLEQATHLDHLAVNLKEIDNVFKIGEAGVKGLETHGKVPALVQRAAREIEKTLEQAISSGRISEADLATQAKWCTTSLPRFSCAENNGGDSASATVRSAPALEY